MFEQEEQPQVRNRLVDTLRWIICQRLLPKEGGGRLGAFEIMGLNLRVQDLILHGESEDRTFYGIIEDGASAGWRTFDMSILDHYEHGLITEETAMAYCSKKSAMNRGLDRIKAMRGESTTSITGLTMK
jgi:twitching motility protein PilT